MFLISEIYFDIVQWIIDIVSVIFVTLILRRTSKLIHQMFIFYMSLILSISCFIRPIINLLTLIAPMGSGGDDALAALTYSIIQFSIFWSAAISIFAYLATNYTIPLSAKNYTRVALLTCSLSSLFLFILIITKAFDLGTPFYTPGIFSLEFEGDKKSSEYIGYLIIIDVWGKILPILINTFCFYKVFRKLKIYSQPNPARVLLYPLVQAVCLLPHVLCDFFPGFLRPYTLLAFIVTFLDRVEEPLYLYIYWYLTLFKNREINAELSTDPII